MLKYTLIILMALLCLHSQGQNLQGVVVDQATQQPVPGAIVSIKNFKTITNSDGIFELQNIVPNDTLKVSSMGFYTAVLPLAGMKNYMRVLLYTQNTMLNQVDVTGQRSSKQDSLRNRQDFAKEFNYKRPRMGDAFGPMSQPGQTLGFSPSAILGALSYKKTNEYKLQQHLVTDEHENFIDSRFNARVVTATVQAHGDTLANFLRWYRPSYEFVQKASAYEMIMYIRTSYQHFGDLGYKTETPEAPSTNPFDNKGKPVTLSGDQ